MNDYLTALNEAFGTEDALNPAKLMAFSGATMKFFQELQKKLASDNPAEKEAAMNEAKTMKSALEEKVKKLCDKWGIDPQALEKMMPDTSSLELNKNLMKEEELPSFKMKA
jgi:phage terminase small subunit